jgi:hypothetical protein
VWLPGIDCVVQFRVLLPLDLLNHWRGSDTKTLVVEEVTSPERDAVLEPQSSGNKTWIHGMYVCVCVILWQEQWPMCSLWPRNSFLFILSVNRVNNYLFLKGWVLRNLTHLPAVECPSFGWFLVYLATFCQLNRSCSTLASLQFRIILCSVSYKKTWRYKTLCRIWGSHGGEYEDGCLLGCCAVQSGRSLPTF